MFKKIITLVTILMLAATTAFAKDKKDSNSYKYVSSEYKYSIMCPKKPNVVSASVFFQDETKKGEVLIFENELYEVKRGWVILFDAFNTNSVPDFNKDSKKLLEQYLEKLQKQGYEGTTLIDVTKKNKGILAITSLEIQVDTNGDGTPDDVLIADHQEAVTFFRTPSGKCMSIQLIGKDGLNEAALKNYRLAISTFSDVVK